MAINDGPQLEDPGVIAQRMMGAGKGAQGGDAEKNSPIDFIEGYLRKFTKLPVKGLLETGITKIFGGDSKGFLDGEINKGAKALTANGGAATNLLSKGLQTQSLRDFSKIAPLDVPKLEVKEAPVDTSFAPTTMFASSGGRGSFDLS